MIHAGGTDGQRLSHCRGHGPHSRIRSGAAREARRRPIRPAWKAWKFILKPGRAGAMRSARDHGMHAVQYPLGIINIYNKSIICSEYIVLGTVSNKTFNLSVCYINTRITNAISSLDMGYIYQDTYLIHWLSETDKSNPLYVLYI